ncbi:MAG TPA: sigma-70 family RNA polymerase sigma factor [Candidatus Acidoferrales bacterium]|nr:sigma-70 family RNA polymerase sigma factor [Candidatus Acidoferrales bacterium]
MNVVQTNTNSDDPVGLIRDVLQGRTEAFIDLTRPHMRLVTKLVRAHGINCCDVDDVIQQTLLKALSHLNQFRYEASFRTWLCRIALNEVRQYARFRSRSRIVDFDEEFLENICTDGGCASPFTTIENGEIRQRIQAAVATLPHGCRVVVELRMMQSRTTKETARLLNLSIEAVKSRHFRGKIILRRVLAKELALRSRQGPVA